MKHAMTWILSSFAMLTLNAHAEPVRKVAGAVDLDAAARATAALYATPQPVVRGQQAAGKVSRPSPLLPAAPAAAPEAAPAVAASAANDVWVGSYHCELSERVSLRPGAAADQVELQWKNQRWNLRRTDSRSGAMRLEDASARVVWIQLANKSMLLDQKQGRRLLDECQHDVQVQTAAQMKNNPPASLFDTNGTGR